MKTKQELFWPLLYTILCRIHVPPLNLLYPACQCWKWRWMDRARQRWGTESEEEREVRFHQQRESDRQWQDAETEDEWEARLCRWREIGRGELLWTPIHWTLSCLAYVSTLLMSLTHEPGLPWDLILITKSHSSLSPDDHHLSTNTH